MVGEDLYPLSLQYAFELFSCFNYGQLFNFGHTVMLLHFCQFLLKNAIGVLP
jgi:hypothetical protein